MAENALDYSKVSDRSPESLVREKLIFDHYDRENRKDHVMACLMAQAAQPDIIKDPVNTANLVSAATKAIFPWLSDSLDSTRAKVISEESSPEELKEWSESVIETVKAKLKTKRFREKAESLGLSVEELKEKELEEEVADG